MDGTSLTVIVPSVMAVISALIAVFMVITKGNTNIKVDDATLIRSNLIPTSVWLEQQAKRDEEIRQLNTKIDAQRQDYERRLSEKDVYIQKISENFRNEIEARDVEIEKLKDELRDVRHRVGNVEQAEQFRKDNISTHV